MLQQDSLSTRSRSLLSVVLCVAVALVMSVGSVQAASIGASDNPTDQTSGHIWEYVWVNLVAGVVMPNGDVWITHPSKEAALEAASGETATVQSLADFVDALPTAGANDVVRFEDGIPDQTGIQELAEKGYSSYTPVTPASGFNSAGTYGQP